MRIQLSEFATRGQVFFVADLDHPELSFLGEMELADGTVAVCHPDDEQSVRDMLARVGEHRDVGEWATRIRRSR